MTSDLIESASNPGAADQAPAKVKATSANSILVRMAEKFGLDTKVLYNTLAATCFRKPDGNPPSKEEMVSLLIISEKANLNPMLGEIYAFPGKNGGIVPIVGINGWRQIAAANPEYAGLRFEFSQEKATVAGVTCPEWIKCIVTRKRPDGTLFEVEGYAFFSEKFRPTEPWQKQPRQMLCNKAQIQALKNAFPSLSSIYDEEEGREAGITSVAQMEQASRTQTATPVWSRPQLETKLKEVTAIAEQRNAWAIATKWVMEKTSGADQEFALEYVARARMGTNVEDVQVVEPPAAKAAEPSDF